MITIHSEPLSYEPLHQKQNTSPDSNGTYSTFSFVSFFFVLTLQVKLWEVKRTRNNFYCCICRCIMFCISLTSTTHVCCVYCDASMRRKTKKLFCSVHCDCDSRLLMLIFQRSAEHLTITIIQRSLETTKPHHINNLYNQIAQIAMILLRLHDDSLQQHTIRRITFNHNYYFLAHQC